MDHQMLQQRSAFRDLGGDLRGVEAATSYWNAHKHPFIWSRRRRRRPRRQPGIAVLPAVV